MVKFIFYIILVILLFIFKNEIESSPTTTRETPPQGQLSVPLVSHQTSPPTSQESSSTASNASDSNNHKFAIGELIWGPSRGYPAWPGKIIQMPEGVCSTSQTGSEAVWIQWFGTIRTNAELVPLRSLQSLSEGLEIHHKAQKETRKWALSKGGIKNIFYNYFLFCYILAWIFS